MRGQMDLYGAEITIGGAGGGNSALAAAMDAIADRVALIADANGDFEGWMITGKTSGEQVFLVSVTAPDELAALAAALAYVDMAVRSSEMEGGAVLRGCRMVVPAELRPPSAAAGITPVAANDTGSLPRLRYRRTALSWWHGTTGYDRPASG